MAEMTGSIVGSVQGNQGEQLPGVVLQLTGGLEPVTTVSSAKGSFRFLHLKPNDYKLTATLEGFNKVVRGIVLRAGKTVIEDIQMTLAYLEESG